MNNTSIHANERVVERLQDAGFADEKIGQIGYAIDQVAQRFNVDTALKILDLQETVGVAGSDRSNGNQVWAIIRNRRVVTVMLRRNNQPATTKALRVASVKTIQDVA